MLIKFISSTLQFFILTLFICAMLYGGDETAKDSMRALNKMAAEYKVESTKLASLFSMW